MALGPERRIQLVQFLVSQNDRHRRQRCGFEGTIRQAFHPWIGYLQQQRGDQQPVENQRDDTSDLWPAEYRRPHDERDKHVDFYPAVVLLQQELEERNAVYASTQLVFRFGYATDV